MLYLISIDEAGICQSWPVFLAVLTAFGQNVLMYFPESDKRLNDSELLNWINIHRTQFSFFLFGIKVKP